MPSLRRRRMPAVGAAMAAAAVLIGAAPAPVCRDLGTGHPSEATAESVAPGLPSLGDGRATPPLPGFCRVTGTLRPVAGSRIGYELWMPSADAWTGRFQMVGNGGYSSTLPTAAMADALRRGSAVVATDTGHRGDDPDFARGRPESIVDWGWRSVHLTAIAAKSIVRRYYGRPATYTYFNGCSTGGHQAMTEAQRFPADFDGIVAGAPGSDRVRLNAAFLWQYLANHRPGQDDAPILGAGDLALLQRHSLASCKARIDPSDDWLADPLSCRPVPSALLCAPGRTTGCLTAEKVTAARAMYSGARDPRTGTQLTFPWLPGSETGWSGYWANPQKPDEPARANFWRVWAFDDPYWNWWHAAFARDLAATQARLSPIIDAQNPDLSRFRARGGKLLHYHGLVDPVVSPLDTLAYRSSVMRAMQLTPERLATWFRLFLVPGMGHCAGGPGFTAFDAQTAIEHWVENGRPPDALSTTSSRQPGRTRLLRPVGAPTS